MNKLSVIIKKPRLLIPVRNHLMLNALRVINSLSSKADMSKARLPESITIRISGICNLKCKMCSYICNKQKTRYIELNVVNNLIKDLDSSWPYISITGGEPLLHPELEQILKITKKGNRFVTLTTNGTLLKQKVNLISKSNLDTLIVSLDGPKDIHDKIRGIDGTYDKAIDGIQSLLKKKKRPSIFLNCSMNSLNFSKLEQIVKIAKELGVDGINFQHLWFLTDTARLPQNQKMLPDELKTFNLVTLWSQIRKIKKTNIPINIFPNLSFYEIVQYYQTAANFKPRFTNKGTDCPWHHVIVKTNGKIVQCNRYIMGDLKDENFWSIWNGPNYKKFRKHIYCKNKSLPECIRCCNYFRD